MVSAERPWFRTLVTAFIGWLSAHRFSAGIMIAAAIGFGLLGPLLSSRQGGYGAPISLDPQALVLRPSDVGADFTANASKSGPGWPPCGHQSEIEKDRVASYGITLTAVGKQGLVRSLAYEYVSQEAAASAFASLNRQINDGFDVWLCLNGIKYRSAPSKIDWVVCPPQNGMLYSLGGNRRIAVWINHNVVDLLDVNTTLPVHIEQLRLRQDSLAPLRSASECAGP